MTRPQSLPSLSMPPSLAMAKAKGAGLPGQQQSKGGALSDKVENLAHPSPIGVVFGRLSQRTGQALNSLPENQGGTYLFQQSANKSSYVGSAFSFKERMIQHQNQFAGAFRGSSRTRALHKLEFNRQDSLILSLIHIVPNYYKLFKISYPSYILSKGEYEILVNMTIYPSRVLEQNLITVFKPDINGFKGKYYTTVIQKFNS